MNKLNEIVASRIAEFSLIDPRGGARELAKEFTGTDREWLASAEPEPNAQDRARSPAVLSEEEVARLTKERKLRDISKLQFDRSSLERELRSMIKAHTDSVPRELYALCGLSDSIDFDESPLLSTVTDCSDADIDFSAPVDLETNIRELAEILSALNLRYPELVRLAMQAGLRARPHTSTALRSVSMMTSKCQRRTFWLGWTSWHAFNWQNA